MQRIAEGVLRLTFPLPLGIGHVHCYLLEGEDGWTLVDTAIAFPGAEEHWREVAAGLDGPVARIVVTHFHPDHVGGAEPAAAATGAPVLQGREDYERCADVWGRPDWSGGSPTTSPSTGSRSARPPRSAASPRSTAR